MRALVRPLLAMIAMAGAMGVSASSAAGAGDGSAAVTLALRTTGDALAWHAPTLEAASDGASVPVVLDTTGVSGVRSDVIRLTFTVDAGTLTVGAPSPFGETVEIAAASAGGPGDGFVQVGRRIPLTLTLDAPGPQRVGIAAVVPGATSPLHAATELVVATAATPSAAGGGQASARPSTLAAATAARESRPSSPRSPLRQAAAAPVVIASGHVDMGPRIVEGRWRIQLKDDTVSPAVWRELSDVVLHAVDASKRPVPTGPQFEFLGRAGSDIWLLPQAQQAGIIWPGWNTQDPSIGPVATGPVTWRLLGVDGPGSFALFLTGSFGTPEVIFDSDRPLPQQHPIALGTHVHGNWAFTEPGTYRLEVEMSAPTSSGAVADTRTLTFAVGDVDPERAAGGTTSTTLRPGSSGSTQQLTTSRGGRPSTGAGGSAGGAMADTGIDALGPKLLLAGGLLAAGTGLLRARRRDIELRTSPTPD